VWCDISGTNINDGQVFGETGSDAVRHFHSKDKDLFEKRQFLLFFAIFWFFSLAIFRPTRQVLFWNPPDKRKPGRPSATWQSSIRKETGQTTQRTCGISQQSH
jgi:hypothetical protein